MVRLKDFDQIEQDALKRNIPIMQKEGILFLISQLNQSNFLFRDWFSNRLFIYDDGDSC